MGNRLVAGTIVVLLVGMFTLAFFPFSSFHNEGSLPSTVVVYAGGQAASSSAPLSALIPAQQPVNRSDSAPEGQGSASLPAAGGTGQYLFASAPASGSNFYWAGGESFATSALSNTGIQAAIQVVSTPASGCLSFWVADEMSSNSVWGQVGYYICNGATPVAFYQIWTSGTVTVTGTTSVTVGSHLFSMYLASGTTWAYALDGAVFGSYNMGSSVSSSSYPVEVLSEEGYVSSSWNPPQVGFAQVQVLNGATWSPVSTAFEPYACGSSSYSCWGVQGNQQNPAIAPDALAVGGTNPTILSGTTLWSGSATTSSTTSSISTSTVTSITSTSISSSTSATSQTSSSTTSSSSFTSSQGAPQSSLTISPASVPQKSTVYFTVTLTNGQGVAVSGASVSLTVVKPDGKSVVVTSTTNGVGQAYFQYKVSAAAQVGVYAVSAVASTAGYASSIVTGTFTVV